MEKEEGAHNIQHTWSGRERHGAEEQQRDVDPTGAGRQLRVGCARNRSSPGLPPPLGDIISVSASFCRGVSLELAGAQPQ